MKIQDNVIIDILTAPYYFVLNTIDTIKYEGNLKSIYKYIFFSNLLSYILALLKANAIYTLYYHIGSLLFIAYVIYITKNTTHKKIYKDIYEDIKGGIDNVQRDFKK